MFSTRASRVVRQAKTTARVVNQQRLLIAPRPARIIVAASETQDRSLLLQASLLAGITTGAGFFLSESNILHCEDAGTVVEPLSSFEFPKVFRSETGNQAMLGVGTRTVTFMQFYVYAAALYVDENLKSKLRDVDPPSDGDGPMSRDLIAAVASEDVKKTLYIQPYREVDLKHMRDGFSKALTYRLGKSDMTDADKFLHMQEISEFKTLFPTRESLAVQEPLVLSFTGSRVTVIVKGKPTGTLCSPYIVKTLIESYLDETPVSTNIYKSCKGGLRSYF